MTTEKPPKTEKQEQAEKLAKEVSENVLLAQRIMANMTRQRRTVAPVQPQIVYERR